jgi:hypothetical protein
MTLRKSEIHFWGGSTQSADYVTPGGKMIMRMMAQTTYSLLWAQNHSGGPVCFTLGHFGGVVVNVLSIRPKARGLKPSWGDGFLRWWKSAAHLPLEGK